MEKLQKLNNRGATCSSNQETFIGNNCSPETEDSGHHKLTDSMGKLTLLKHGNQSYAMEASKQMDAEFGEDWRNVNKFQAYIKESEQCQNKKVGDEAEKVLIDKLKSKNLCQKLGEPLYILRGQTFAQRERDNLGIMTGWKIGEMDVMLISRKIGFVLFEVKSIKTQREKDFRLVSCST